MTVFWEKNPWLCAPHLWLGSKLTLSAISTFELHSWCPWLSGQHTTVAIGHQLFAVQTSDFQAEILRQQQQKQDIAKRKRMMASKSRCSPFWQAWLHYIQYTSIKQIHHWLKNIADFNFYKPDSSVKPALPDTQPMLCQAKKSPGGRGSCAGNGEQRQGWWGWSPCLET